MKPYANSNGECLVVSEIESNDKTYKYIRFFINDNDYNGLTKDEVIKPVDKLNKFISK